MKLMPTLLCLLPGVVIANHLGDTSLAAPFSGKKCTEYKIELPISRETKQQFSVPEDCASIRSHMLGGSSRWGSMIEKKLWHKAHYDCQLIDFLHHNKALPVADFISNYDFFNAPISDFPTSISCKLQTNVAICKQFEATIPKILNMLFPEILTGNKQVDDWGDCRLSNGVFRGRLIKDQDRIICQTDRKARGIRIIDVDYANINGDEYLDALLRIVKIGSNARRTTVLFPLTRLSPDGPLMVPPNTNIPAALNNK